MPLCANCGHESPDLAKFCEKCGSAIATPGAARKEDFEKTQVIRRPVSSDAKSAESGGTGDETRSQTVGGGSDQTTISGVTPSAQEKDQARAVGSQREVTAEDKTIAAVSPKAGGSSEAKTGASGSPALKTAQVAKPPSGPAAKEKRSKTPLIIGILVVLVLCCGGIAAYVVMNQDAISSMISSATGGS